MDKPEWDEVAARIGPLPVAVLATVDARGEQPRPHLAPFCFAVSGRTVYWAVDSKPKRSLRLQRLVNLATVPRAAILFHHYETDWSRLWWIRLDGAGREVTDLGEREAALSLLLAKYPQYRAAPPRGPVVAIDVDGWHAWSGAQGSSS